MKPMDENKNIPKVSSGKRKERQSVTKRYKVFQGRREQGEKSILGMGTWHRTLSHNLYNNSEWLESSLLLISD